MENIQKYLLLKDEILRAKNKLSNEIEVTSKDVKSQILFFKFIFVGLIPFIPLFFYNDNELIAFFDIENIYNTVFCLASFEILAIFFLRPPKIVFQIVLHIFFYVVFLILYAVSFKIACFLIFSYLLLKAVLLYVLSAAHILSEPSLLFKYILFKPKSSVLELFKKRRHLKNSIRRMKREKSIML